MKKYWISGVVVAVVAAVVVGLSMFLCGGDKFVGSWYMVKLQPAILFTSPYIEQVTITKNGDAYLVVVNNHFHKGKGKWRTTERAKLIATKADKNCIETNYYGMKISLKYNEKDNTITARKKSFTKLDTSIEELKTKVEPQMIEAEEKREKAMKSTDGLGIRFNDIKFKK